MKTAKKSPTLDDKTEVLDPGLYAGCIGSKWCDRPHRGARVLKVVGRVQDRLRVFKRWDPAVPGYVKVVQLVPAWQLEVLSGEEFASTTRAERAHRRSGLGTLGAPKAIRVTNFVTTIRDDCLKRLFQRVEA